MFDVSLYLNVIRETLYMTFISSVVSYLFGIPLGILLYVTQVNSLMPNKFLYDILSLCVNLLRSIPFLILLILVLPITKFIVGSTIGPTAVIVPLVISATPYIARMVESSMTEVDLGVIEAAKSMGVTNLQIIYKVLLVESCPSLLVGAAISITTILGYSAMAGVVSGGGLGDVAIRYGYYRYNNEIMFISVALLVIVVQIIQETLMYISRKSDKRIK